MIYGIVITLSILLNIALAMVLRRFVTRTIQFDDVLNSIYDDMEKFIIYSDELLLKSTFSRSPEMMGFCQNLKIMRNRMDMYISEAGRVVKTKQNKQEKPVAV